MMNNTEYRIIRDKHVNMSSHTGHETEFWLGDVNTRLAKSLRKHVCRMSYVCAHTNKMRLESKRLQHSWALLRNALLMRLGTLMETISHRRTMSTSQTGTLPRKQPHFQHGTVISWQLGRSHQLGMKTGALQSSMGPWGNESTASERPHRGTSHQN